MKQKLAGFLGSDVIPIGALKASEEVMTNRIVGVSGDLLFEVGNACLSRGIVKNAPSDAGGLEVQFRKSLQHRVALHCGPVGNIEECLGTSEKYTEGAHRYRRNVVRGCMKYSEIGG